MTLLVMGSRPSRARGLKPASRARRGKPAGSRPTRARGLKLVREHDEAELAVLKQASKALRDLLVSHGADSNFTVLKT